MTDITVYHSIWQFITVYNCMKCLKQVHTSTYKYIAVHDCFRTVSNQYTGILVHTGASLWHECLYFDQMVPTASAPGPCLPAWKQQICCFKKAYQFTHTHVSPLFSVLSQKAPGKSADSWRMAKGIVPVAPTRTIGRRPSMEDTGITFKTCAVSRCL